MRQSVLGKPMAEVISDPAAELAASESHIATIVVLLELAREALSSRVGPERVLASGSTEECVDALVLELHETCLPRRLVFLLGDGRRMVVKVARRALCSIEALLPVDPELRVYGIDFGMSEDRIDDETALVARVISRFCTGGGVLSVRSGPSATGVQAHTFGIAAADLVSGLPTPHQTELTELSEDHREGPAPALRATTEAAQAEPAEEMTEAEGDLLTEGVAAASPFVASPPVGEPEVPVPDQAAASAPPMLPLKPRVARPRLTALGAIFERGTAAATGGAVFGAVGMPIAAWGLPPTVPADRVAGSLETQQKVSGAFISAAFPGEIIIILGTGPGGLPSIACHVGPDDSAYVELAETEIDDLLNEWADGGSTS